MNHPSSLVSWMRVAAAASFITALPVCAQSIIVDNSDASFTKGGTWTTTTSGTAHQGSNYLYALSGTNSTAAARWRPTITTAGVYRIYMKWGSAPNRSGKAALEINYDGGSKVDVTRDVSQEENAGAWVYLGAYFFTSGTGNSVRLKPSASGSGNVTADAMLFDFSGSASSDPAGTGVATQQRDETPDSVANVSPEQVEIVRTDSGTDTPYFQLRISGTNFFIKGSCGPEMPPQMVKDAGGNAIRNYNVNLIPTLTGTTADAFLKDADAKGLKVLFGLILTQAEKGNAGYYEEGNVAAQDAQFDATMEIVNQYKKYKSVLAWTIGNELDPLTLPPENRDKVYRYIQRVARAIRDADHYHPVMTCHASTSAEKPTSVKALAPDVDMIGCNSYGPHTPEVYNNYITVANWRGPYIYSVWGIEHPNNRGGINQEATWTEPTWTPPVWKAPIEQLSAAKYLELQDIYQNVILPNEGRTVGAFAFKGANGGFRITHTWFPFLDEQMKPTPCYDAIKLLWGGTATTVAAPRVLTLTIDSQAPESIPSPVVSGTTGAFLAFATTIGAPLGELTYRAEIRRDVDKDAPSQPPILPVTITPHGTDGRKFFVSKPDMAAQGDGYYRLYYYVYRGGDEDTHFSSGSGNIPFQYKKTP